MKIDPRQNRDARIVVDITARWAGRLPRSQGWARRMIGLSVALFAALSSSGQVARPPNQPWTTFVRVEGQPEAVPAEWVATPEGKFAHSIKIPNPVPKDSGYRWWMTSEQYFHHLCKTEAGEFIYKTVENVEGFYFMRPPKRPSDDDLMDRYKLEDPYTERYFQLRRADPRERATKFVNPPWYLYKYVEEPTHTGYWNSSTIREPYALLSGYVQGQASMNLSPTETLRSAYGYIWRGVSRPHDRELSIAGSEVLVVDISSQQTLGVFRNYVRTGYTRNTKEGIWWLNAISCRNVPKAFQDNLGQQLYGFVSKVLQPVEIKK